MDLRKLFWIGTCFSFLLIPALSGQDDVEEPAGKIKARIAAAEKSQIALSDDGKTVIGVRELDRKMYVVPKGVTVIGPKAFAGCTEMRKITLPDTLETIEAEAFKGCIGLKNITIPKGVKKIGMEAFQGCKFKKVEIPQGVVTISARAFYECSELERVLLPSTLVEIKFSAFRGCPKLKDVTLPASLENLASDAFHGRTTIRVAPKNPNFYTDAKGVLFHRESKKLIVAPRALPKRYTIPPDITSIENGAFQVCEEMKCVTIHAGVLKIGDGAFAGVEKIELAAENPNFYLDEQGALIDKERKKVLYVPPTITSEYVVAEGTLAIGAHAFRNCKGLFTVKLPEGLQTVGSAAFYGCENLRRVTLPDSITRIGPWAFYRCKSLRSITLPENLKELESSVFRACTGLTSIKIPKNVTAIWYNAFADSGLRSIVVPDNVKTVDPRAFDGCKQIKEISLPKHISKNISKSELPVTCKITWRK